MSFQAMTWAVAQKLPCQRKMVLLMLANRHNQDTGRCDPSIQNLAEECGLSKRSVQNELRALEAAGLLEVVRRRVGKVNMPNAYRLNWGVPPVVEELDDADIEMLAGGGACGAPLVQEAAKNTLKGGAGHAGGGACGAPGGARRAPEPVIQPISSSSLRFEEDKKTSLASRKGSRLPDGWKPSPADVEFARAKCPAVNWQAEAEKFADYWRAMPGAKGVKADWSATWRNWLRKASEDVGRWRGSAIGATGAVPSEPYTPGGGMRRLA